MPTLEPSPVEEPKNELEKIARIGAVAFIREFFGIVNGYSYSTRSHMPGGMDHTDFSKATNMLHKFCSERPDWTLDMLSKALQRFDPNYTAAYELQKLQDVIQAFEKEAGIKLHPEFTNKNTDIAKAIAAGKNVIEAEKTLKKAQDHAKNTMRTLERVKQELGSLL